MSRAAEDSGPAAEVVWAFRRKHIPQLRYDEELAVAVLRCRNRRKPDALPHRHSLRSQDATGERRAEFEMMGN